MYYIQTQNIYRCKLTYIIIFQWELKFFINFIIETSYDV